MSQEEFNQKVNKIFNDKDGFSLLLNFAIDNDNVGYNYSTIEDCFINEKNVFYISEYVSVIEQCDYYSVTKKIIELNDNDLIKCLLGDYIFYSCMPTKYLELLHNKLFDYYV